MNIFFRFSLKLILFLSTAIIGFAQEGLPFYEHYLVTDNYLINPSFAGSNPEVLTIRGSYSSQWSGVEDAPSTQTISAHATLVNRLAGGLYVFHDRNGASSLTGFNLSAAYHIPIGDGYSGKIYDKRENLFSFGVSYNGFNQSLDRSKLNPDTWDDPLLNETSYYSSYFNVGASFYYNGIFGGVSVLDIPLGDNVYVTNTIEPLPTWYYLQGGYNFFLSESVQLTPSFLMAVNSNSERQTDITFRSKFHSGNNAFGLGINYRTAKDDSGNSLSVVSPLVDLQIGKMTVGYAYRWGSSKIYNELGGGHLISLGFDLGNPFSPLYY